MEFNPVSLQALLASAMAGLTTFITFLFKDLGSEQKAMDYFVLFLGVFVTTLFPGLASAYSMKALEDKMATKKDLDDVVATMATKEDLKEAMTQNKKDLDDAVATRASKDDLKDAMDAMVDAMKKGFDDINRRFDRRFEEMNRRFDSLERPYIEQIHGRLNTESPPLTPDTPVDPAADTYDFFAPGSKVPESTFAQDVADDLLAREVAIQDAKDAAEIFALVNDMVDAVVHECEASDEAPDAGPFVDLGPSTVRARKGHRSDGDYFAAI